MGSVTVKEGGRGFTVHCDSGDGAHIECDVMQDGNKRVTCLNVFDGNGIEIHSPQDLQCLAQVLVSMANIMSGNGAGAITYRPIMP